MGFAASGETLFKTRCGAKDFFDKLKDTACGRYPFLY